MRSPLILAGWAVLIVFVVIVGSAFSVRLHGEAKPAPSTKAKAKSCTCGGACVCCNGCARE